MLNTTYQHFWAEFFQQNIHLEQNNIYAFRTTPKACVIRRVLSNEFRQITFLDYIKTSFAVVRYIKEIQMLLSTDI